MTCRTLLLISLVCGMAGPGEAVAGEQLVAAALDRACAAGAFRFAETTSLEMAGGMAAHTRIQGVWNAPNQCLHTITVTLGATVTESQVYIGSGRFFTRLDASDEWTESQHAKNALTVVDRLRHFAADSDPEPTPETFTTIGGTECRKLRFTTRGQADQGMAPQGALSGVALIETESGRLRQFHLDRQQQGGREQSQWTYTVELWDFDAEPTIDPESIPELESRNTAVAQPPPVAAAPASPPSTPQTAPPWEAPAASPQQRAGAPVIRISRPHGASREALLAVALDHAGSCERPGWRQSLAKSVMSDVGTPLLDAVSATSPARVVVARLADAPARIHVALRDGDTWQVGRVESRGEKGAWRTARLRAVETSPMGAACIIVVSRPGAGDETEVDLVLCRRGNDGWVMTWRLGADVGARHQLRTIHPGMSRLPAGAEFTPLRAGGLPVVAVFWYLDAAPVMRGAPTRRLRRYQATLRSDGRVYRLAQGEFAPSAFETCWQFLWLLQQGRERDARQLCTTPGITARAVACGLFASHVTWLGLTQRADSEVQEFYHGTRGRFRMSLTRNGDEWTISGVERVDGSAP